MIKLWLAAGLGFAALVLIFFLVDSAAHVLDLLPSVAASSAGTPAGTVHGDLSKIDFSEFTKGGSGWRFMTQGYGTTPSSYLYIGRWHNGIDIGASYGATILSANDGTVVATGDQDAYCPGKAFGKFVVVKDPARDVDVMYAHLGTIRVASGEKVLRDSNAIGTVGETGLETGPHLHLSVFKDDRFTMAAAYGCGPYPQGRDIDPISYLESLQ